MDEKQEIAIDAYKSGCNCTQSTISALYEELGLTEEQARRLMGGFGGGFGGMQEVCGAFSCVCAAIGYLYTEDNHEPTEDDLFSQIQKAAEKFKEENGSIICLEILHEKNLII